MAAIPTKANDPGAGDQAETFGLTWPGKAAALAAVDTPPASGPPSALRWGPAGPVGDQSPLAVGENLLIEGDNLDALKLLQATHASRFKLIYIDPPYNTGADALYADDYSAPRAAPRRRGARDTDDDPGLRHGAWLSMIYPRLVLARRLLRDDGVMFISIDAAELAHLILVCDEVFGEANRIEVFSWVRTTTPASLSGKTKKVVEYLLCYERRRGAQVYRGVEKPVRSTNSLLNQSNPVSRLVFPAGVATTALPDGTIAAGSYGSAAYAVDLLADATVEGGRFVSPVVLRGRFRWSPAYLEAQLAAGVAVRIATARLIPAYAKPAYGREALPNLIDAKVGVGGNETATAELRELLGPQLADLARRMRPKPVSLLKYLIDAVCGPHDLVLDFFAGSGVTGQAVLELNAEKGLGRRFILVQSPEPTGHLGCPTIAEIARRRLAVAAARLPPAGPGEERAVKLITLAAPGVAKKP